MTERYVVWMKTSIVDTQQKSAVGHDCPLGLVVAYSDPAMAEKLAFLLNEDLVIDGLVQGYSSHSEFVDDVVRHTKVQK